MQEYLEVTPSKGRPSWPSLNTLHTILMINAFGTHEMTDLSVYQYHIALTATKSDDWDFQLSLMISEEHQTIVTDEPIGSRSENPQLVTSTRESGL